MTTLDNCNVQSHEQEESKLNSNINANSGAYIQKIHSIRIT